MTTKGRWSAAVLVAGLAACGGGDGGGGGGPTTPPVEPARKLEVMSGNGQGGFGGGMLQGPLVVRVTRGGQAVPDVLVTFSATAGRMVPDHATTDADGIAQARWQMPEDEAAIPAARATAQLASGTAADSVMFSTRLARRDEMDLFTAPAGLPVRLVAYNAGDYRASEVVRHTFTDSMLVRFRDYDMSDEIAAFAPGHAPVLVLPGWRARRDTMHLPFSSEVFRMPITIWVVQPPFDSTAKLVQMNVQAVAQVWEPQGRIGLRDVRIVDATGFPQAHRFQGDSLLPCNPEAKTAIGWDAGRLNAYYLGQTHFREFGVTPSGSYCGDAWIEILPLAWDRTRTILAHEIGHGFLGGDHESSPENLMFGRGGTGKLTEGQLFRAHYSRDSILNTLFGAHPSTLWRTCHPTPDALTPGCLPTSFVVD
jgi:hypothetical protein